MARRRFGHSNSADRATNEDAVLAASRAAAAAALGGNCRIALASLIGAADARGAARAGGGVSTFTTNSVRKARELMEEVCIIPHGRRRRRSEKRR